MTVVIDASVAVKWVLPEEGAERATALCDGPDELIAPTLIAAEIGSAMQKHVAAKHLSKLDALSAARVATSLVDRMVPIPELAARALEISIEFKHPIYDCFSLALAERERAPLISADKPLIAVAKRTGIEVRSL